MGLETSRRNPAPGVIGGFAPLDSGLLVPVGYLGSGTPSAAKVLRGDGTWDNDNLTLLDTQTLGANGTITFSSIPATYKDLVLVGRVRDDAASEIVASGPMIRVGATTVDSGGNYDYAQSEMQQNGTITPSAGVGATAGHIARSCNGDSASANFWSRHEVEIYDYASTATFRSYLSRGFVMSTTNFRVLMGGGGQWKNAADAIDIIQILGVAAGDMVAGTTFRLYGRA